MGQSCSYCCDKTDEQIQPSSLEVEDRVAQVRGMLKQDANGSEMGVSGLVEPPVKRAKQRLSIGGVMDLPGVEPLQTEAADASLDASAVPALATAARAPRRNSTTSLANQDMGRIVSCKSDERDLQKQGIDKIFSPGSLGDRKASMIASITDRDGGKRSSFKEKNEEILSPPGLKASSEDEHVGWLQEIGLGWACKKGLKANSPNQDSFSILAVENDFVLIGVYDGHGPDGHDVSQFAREECVRLFIQHPLRGEDTEEALKQVFEEVQRRIAQVSGADQRTSNKGKSSPGPFDAWDSGSTATLVYVDIPKQTATFAHVGDARACLGKRRAGQKEFIAEEITKDHKPNDPKEKKRIQSAKPPGRVIFDGYVNYRVFVKDGMYPGLNMSRAFGDVCAHKLAGLTALPDTRTVDLKPLLAENEEVTVLACTDGVWEFIDGKKAFSIVADGENQNADSVMNRLALKAWDKWMEDSNNEISDDISGVCLHLHLTFPKQV